MLPCTLFSRDWADRSLPQWQHIRVHAYAAAMIVKLKHLDEWEHTGMTCDSRPTVDQQHNVQALDIVAAQRREICLGTRYGVRDYFW